MRTLYDSRDARDKEGFLQGGPAVTLGGAGLVDELVGLLRSCREWDGPKVRRRATVGAVCFCLGLLLA